MSTGNDEITIEMVKGQNKKALGLKAEYDELVEVRDALTTIKGLISKSMTSFELSSKSMGDVVYKASEKENLYCEGFNKYIEMAKGNQELIDNKISKINGYSGDIETALGKVEIAIKDKHDEYVDAYNTLNAYIAWYSGPEDASQYAI